MSKKLFGGGKRKAAAATATPESKGPITAPLLEGTSLADRIKRRRGVRVPTLVGNGLNVTLGG